jgi:hypothetical protein
MSKFHAIAITILLAACKFPELPPLEDDASPDAPGDGTTAKYQLTLVVDGAGSGAGSISVEPGGFTCSSAMCTRDFDAGTTLTVSVAGASTLDGVLSVGGDCTASPCELTMDQDRTVTAQFVRYACVPNTASCTANAFTECDATGNYVTHVIPNGSATGTPVTITMQDYACPMGCHSTEPRCADITLGNGVEAAMDTPEVSPTGRDVVLPAPGAPDGTVQIATNEFDAAEGIIRVTDTDGNPIDIPAQLVDQGGDAGTILVLKTRTFSLRAGSTLRAVGNHKLGIAANFDIWIAGTLDLRGVWGSGLPEPGAGGGSPSGCAGEPAPVTGGGGTGGGASACPGGASSTGLAGGQPSLVQPPFVMAGCAGGRISGLIAFPSPPGGGLLLVSRTKVVLMATAIIDLTGFQGTANATNAQGGAAGGSAVIMAPSVRVDNGAIVSARGGSGGAANGTIGVPGSRGPLTGSMPAYGATCTGCGTGGAGGYEDPGGWCNGTVGIGSGSAIAGGGGAVGRCTTYARAGAVSVAAGTMKCLYSVKTMQAR